MFAAKIRRYRDGPRSPVPRAPFTAPCRTGKIKLQPMKLHTIVTQNLLVSVRFKVSTMSAVWANTLLGSTSTGTRGVPHHPEHSLFLVA